MVFLNMDGPTRDRVMKLILEKDRLEAAIRDQTAILETNHVGMHDPLVDAEGFPFAHIDVYQVRHARHQIICLQNDHKNIMKFIERGLAELHSNFRANGGTGAPTEQATTSQDHPMNGTSNGHSVTEESFATVGFVTNGSPADVAGLCEKDEILEFGSVNRENFNDISQIMDIVGHSVGQRINIKIKRDHNIMNVTVVPRPWQQPGLLGCQILRKS